MIRCPFGNNLRCNCNWNQCGMNCNCGYNSAGNHNSADDRECFVEESPAQTSCQSDISPVLAVLPGLLANAFDPAAGQNSAVLNTGNIYEEIAEAEDEEASGTTAKKEVDGTQTADIWMEPVCIKEQQVFIKCRSFGGIILPEQVKVGSTYRLAAIEIHDISGSRFCTELNFACNLILANAAVRLGFQIVKSIGNQEVPVGSRIYYFRSEENTQADAVMFSVQDHDGLCNGSSVYSVYAEIIGETSAANMMIQNPILTAMLVEIPADRQLHF